MAVVIVDSEPELVHDLGEPAAQLAGVEWRAVPHDALELRASADPAAALVVTLGADIAGGFAQVARLKQAEPTRKVIAVASAVLDASHHERITASGCDALLVSPMTVTELRDAVAVALGIHRPGDELVAVGVSGAGGPDGTSRAMVSNLSVDGARLITDPPLVEGAEVTIHVSTEHGVELHVPGVVTWAQPRDGKHVVGVAFGRAGAPLEPAAAAALAALTQWALVREGSHLRVIPRGDFTEATRFDGLAGKLAGRVIFDCEHVTYMNSMGVRAWCEFLRALRTQGYEFHACSTAFTLQASMIGDVIGRGTVVSCFAPYHCATCDRSSERLLQAAVVLALGGEPPAFRCACGGIDEFDDLPARYFSFLSGED